MRGSDEQNTRLFSYLSPEDRVPKDHPLRGIRLMVNRTLEELSPVFEGLYSREGRPSVPPEQLLRALLIQILYSVRSERMLMEQLEYNLLFRWFVGLSMDDPTWVPSVFSKNRDRLLEGDVARALLTATIEEARRRGYCRTSTSPWTVPF
jgi:transposase